MSQAIMGWHKSLRADTDNEGIIRLDKLVWLKITPNENKAAGAAILPINLTKTFIPWGSSIDKTAIKLPSNMETSGGF